MFETCPFYSPERAKNRPGRGDVRAKKIVRKLLVVRNSISCIVRGRIYLLRKFIDKRSHLARTTGTRHRVLEKTSRRYNKNSLV